MRAESFRQVEREKSEQIRKLLKAAGKRSASELTEAERRSLRD